MKVEVSPFESELIIMSLQATAANCGALTQNLMQQRQAQAIAEQQLAEQRAKARAEAEAAATLRKAARGRPRKDATPPAANGAEPASPTQ